LVVVKDALNLRDLVILKVETPGILHRRKR